MKASEALQKAKALIQSPERWIQGNYARDKEGNAVLTTDPAACAFCARGALLKVYDCTQTDPTSEFKTAHAVLVTASNQVTPYLHSGVIYVNDYCGHAKALEMFDRAIVLALQHEAGVFPDE